MRTTRALAVVALGCGGLAACGSSLPARPLSPREPPPANEAAAANVGERALFDQLVADVRRLHVFTLQTAKNLGRRWEDDLPGLAREFEHADTHQKLSVAVEHFVNALHNPHCGFGPSLEPDELALGFNVTVEWEGETPTFRVAKVNDAALAALIAEGDVVRSVDGVPAGALLETHALVSRANNRRGVARDIGHWLTERVTSRSMVAEGQPSEWVLAGRDGAPKSVKLVWKDPPGTSWSDFSVDYEKDSCGGLWPRTYGSYELSFVGARYCIYASKRAPFRDYPIVRHFSFAYIEDDWSPSPTWLAQIDQRNLQSQLASLSPKGVILDLRDNGGGNNPNWFLDWWAPAGWIDNRVLVRLDEQLRDRAARQRAEVSLGDGKGTWYAAQLDRRTKGQELSAPRPFFCKPGPVSDPGARDCEWDNRYSPTHRVTPAPVALLVGPGCVSSCDALAQAFDENDFGPLVGEPTAAGYTTSRMKLPATDASGFLIGSIRIAITKEVSGRSGRDLEAVPIHLDYPIDRTFDERDSYDASLVAGALRGFREFRFPGRTPAAHRDLPR